MKRLMLLRHTKSTWASPDIEDIDRTLNKRGKRSAKALGQWLQAQNLLPQRVLCSSSRRTRETWEGLGLPGTPELRDDLYEGTPEALLSAIREADSEVETVLMIAHNPGIAMLARALLSDPPDEERFGDYPTGALTVMSFDVPTFAAAADGTGTLETFVTPHDLVEG